MFQGSEVLDSVTQLFIDKPADEQPMMVLGAPNSDTAEPVATLAKVFSFMQVGSDLPLRNLMLGLPWIGSLHSPLVMHNSAML